MKRGYKVRGKVILAVLLICSMFITACGHEQVASDKALSRAQNAVDVVEQYFKGEITSNSAYEKVKKIQDELSYVSEYSSEEKLADKTKFADYMIHLDVVFLFNELLNDSYYGSAESYDKVKEAVNKIKEDIKKY